MSRNGSGVYELPFPDVETMTPIESAVYNGFTNDVANDLNLPRPIIAGGTAANNARDAMIALKGEISGEQVTNYDSHPFVAGSFWSAPGATSAPAPAPGFSGVCHAHSAGYMTLEAWSYEGPTAGKKYVRQKVAGVWDASWREEVVALADSDARYVNVAGDTMAGALAIQHANASLTVDALSSNSSIVLKKSASGLSNDIWGYYGALPRWILRVGNHEPESGGGAGSNLSFWGYNDAGDALTANVTINRANGYFNTNGGFSGGGTIRAGHSGAGGTYYFGSTAAKYLTHDGTNYYLVGGQFIVDSGYITVGGGIATGTLFFGNTGARYLQYDGTNFNLVGAPLVAPSVTANVNVVANSALIGMLDVWAGYSTTNTGILRFGSAGTRYLQNDGTNFNLVGGSLNVTSYSFTLGSGAGIASIILKGGSETNQGGFLQFERAGVVKWYAGQEAAILADNSDDFIVYSNGVGPVLVLQKAALGITVTGTITSNSSLGLNVTGVAFPSGVYATSVAQCNPTWANITLQGIHVPGNWAGWRFDSGGTTFDFRNGGTAAKPGGGAWADSSDARIKNVLGDYTSGLDAVAALKPVRYTYKGNDTLGEPLQHREGASEQEIADATGEPTVPYANSPHVGVAISGKEFIGLIAQEAEVSMPELVTKSSGYIDGEKVTDLRDLDTTPLTFAMINAIRELKARVEALEA